MTPRQACEASGDHRVVDVEHASEIGPHQATPCCNRASTYWALSKPEATMKDPERFLGLSDNAEWRKSAEGLLLAIHRNKVADAYLVFLFDDYPSVRERLNRAMTTLKFLPGETGSDVGQPALE